MKLIWKGAAALALTVAGLGAASVPAQAQYYGGNGYGWRGDRWDNRCCDNRRRWEDRRRWERRHWRSNWRGDRGYHRGYRGYDRGYYGYRQRCWTEWAYNPYRDRNVRVRVCR